MIVIIETVRGVSNAGEILALDGIDGALVGPNDLTADLGCNGNYAGAAYASALSRIERAASASDKALGTIPLGDYSLEVLLARGYRLFILGTDSSVVHEAMHTQATTARSIIQRVRRRMPT